LDRAAKELRPDEYGKPVGNLEKGTL
jgi:hypothetical protein